MLAVLDHIEKIRPSIWTFWFRPEQMLYFIAGQYIELYLPHPNPDNRGQHRWFTISSIPSDPLLAITVQFVDKPSTYKQAMQQLQPGTQVHFSEPIGDFVLPKYLGTPIVMMAAGLGITPMQSMITQVNQAMERRPMHLVQLARQEEDLLFMDTFRQAHIDYSPCVTNATDRQGWQGLRGKLDGQRLIDITSQLHTRTSTFSLGDKLFYLSGPEPLVMSVYSDLRTYGIERSQIVLDYFPGYVDL